MDSKKITAICLIVTAVVLFSGSMFFVFSTGSLGKKSETEVLEASEGFLSALNEGDMKSASEYCSSDLTGKFSPEEMVSAAFGDEIEDLVSSGYVDLESIYSLLSDEISELSGVVVKEAVRDYEISLDGISVSNDHAIARAKITGVTGESIKAAAENIDMSDIQSDIQKFASDRLSSLITGNNDGSSGEDIYQDAIKDFAGQFLPLMEEAVEIAESGESTWEISLERQDDEWKVTDVEGWL